LQLAEQLQSAHAESAIETAPAGVSSQLWPSGLTTWVSISPEARGTASHPKLSILLDPEISNVRTAEEAAKWEAICRQKGRGPTLRISAIDAKSARVDAFAAMQAVWPALGSGTGKRLE
jgi:hypothetical protein